MPLHENLRESSLLVFVNERNDNNLGVENQFDEVRDPFKAGIRTSIPDVEPMSG